MALIIGYLPLAITYMWKYFSTQAPAPQDEITTFLVSENYAIGAGSIHGVRQSHYLANKWEMLIHTTLGSLALVLAILQFLPKLRQKFPAMHRWMGRIYFTMMSVAMVVVMYYLFVTPPMTHWIGLPFQIQVWGLAIYTLLTGVLAALAARRRDFIAHQAWIIMNMALMLTAPALRLMWIFLFPLWSAQDLLSNMGAAAVSLGILAPAGATICLLYATPSSSSFTARLHSTRFVHTAGILSVLTLVGVGVVYHMSVQDIPVDMFAWHAGPLIVYASVCLRGRYSHVRSGRVGRAKNWECLFLGACAVPVMMLIGWPLLAHAIDTTDAFIATAMVLVALPIGVAHMSLFQPLIRGDVCLARA